MPPLRSVVAQVGRSMVSTRNFSASSNVTKEAQRTLSAAGKAKLSVVFPYFGFGYCVYVGVECIHMIQYHRKMVKARDELESSRKMAWLKAHSSKVVFNK